MLIDVIILSIVEGITEFLPVSSTGHLIIISEWLKMDPLFSKTFDVAIQLGAILAVIFLYPGYFKFFLKPKNMWSKKSGVIAISILPILVLGFTGRNFIKTHLFTSGVVFTGLIIGGIALIVVDQIFKDRYCKDQSDDKDEITVKQALVIGGFQCIALFPGMSRSGATIVGGLFAGANITTSAAFSFVIAVPVIISAVGYDLFCSMDQLNMNQYGWILLGMAISFIIAYMTMKWFLGIIQNQSLYLFGIYRIILGGIGIWFF